MTSAKAEVRAHQDSNKVGDSAPCYIKQKTVLRDALARSEVPWALGLDPNPEKICALQNKPKDYATYPGLVEDWCLTALDALQNHVCVVKVQTAWFEVLGSKGLEVLERVIAHCHKDLKMAVIADAKRGDIGVSSEAYAKAWLSEDSPLCCDAMTVHAWLGEDAVKPFLSVPQREVFALVRTSNPGAKNLQTMTLEDGRPAYQAIAQMIERLDPDQNTLGMVVGANCPQEAQELRQSHPSRLFLVPGFGAQGGDFGHARSFMSVGNDREGAIFPTSRAVLFPDTHRSESTESAFIRAAESYMESLHTALQPRPA